MTPENAGFYHAAYAVAAVVYVGYALSIRVRVRALRHRLAAASQRTHPDR